ncbi:MAG: glycosyltransferase [Clostridia bacterium]|nr:glycosyltransferase [Clostridia bacterium]
MAQRKIVIIPAYEPPRDFIEYAKRVSEIADKLVVVNDGSSQKYDCVFDEIQKLDNVNYIAYGENRGKGYALKQAFRYCVDNFDDSDVIVTADCDGQHKTEDVKRVAAAAGRRTDTLVLGSRDFRLPSIPKRSRLGNTQMRRMFRMFYGIDVYDTQTGLRGFSVALAREFLLVKGDRFEYEMQMLITASKKKISISELPIETVYFDEPEEHASHFRAISDSRKVVGVILKNLNWYVLSSILSAVLDVAIFFVLASVVFDEISVFNTLISTVVARICSSVLNCYLNFKYVFAGKGFKCVVRYYILWICQLGASYSSVLVFGNYLGIPLTFAKILGDFVLGIISYQIQKEWVFKSRDKKCFYGAIVRFLRPIAKMFSRKYRCNVIPHTDGAIYICRHLDMHGPYTTLKWLDFNVHPMVLHPFFTKQTCYKQYADYTFTERVGKKKGKFNIKAYIASRFVPALVRSIGAIPVYRGSVECIKTFRQAVKCLEKGQNVIVYPDVEYTADSDKESEIYDGFLYIGRFYKKATGKDLRFIPLYIDEKKKSIEEFDEITVEDTKESRAFAAEYIRAAINGKRPT